MENPLCIIGVCTERSGAGEGCLFCERSLVGLGVNGVQRRESARQDLPGRQGTTT